MINTEPLTSHSCICQRAATLTLIPNAARQLGLALQVCSASPLAAISAL